MEKNTLVWFISGKIRTHQRLYNWNHELNCHWWNEVPLHISIERKRTDSRDPELASFCYAKISMITSKFTAYSQHTSHKDHSLSMENFLSTNSGHHFIDIQPRFTFLFRLWWHSHFIFLVAVSFSCLFVLFMCLTHLSRLLFQYQQSKWQSVYRYETDARSSTD